MLGLGALTLPCHTVLGNTAPLPQPSSLQSERTLRGPFQNEGVKDRLGVGLHWQPSAVPTQRGHQVVRGREVTNRSAGWREWGVSGPL